MLNKQKIMHLRNMSSDNDSENDSDDGLSNFKKKKAEFIDEIKNKRKNNTNVSI